VGKRRCSQEVIGNCTLCNQVNLTPGQFQPVKFLGGLFLSPGALLPPLTFVLVAMLGSGGRCAWKLGRTEEFAAASWIV
jgi:hypothetical protein